MKSLLGAAALLAAAGAPASAQTVLHYWDFTTTAEVVSGIPTTVVATPDISLHGTYGEAYPGAGSSLNIVFGAHTAGGGYLIGDVFDGTNATAMDFGTNDFSFSYWSYDDTSDGNTRGPRIFDWLDGTDEGVQIATNAAGVYNLRVDTSDGGASISNNTLGSLVQPPNAWVHIAVVVDRTANQYEIFFNGASQGVVPLSAPSAGTIGATRDMDIGYLNSDGTNNQGEAAGLDDLAFYDGKLSASDIAGLANGTLTPLSFGAGPGAAFCFGDGSDTACPCGNTGSVGEGCQNSSGSGAIMTATGSENLLADDLALHGTQLPGTVPALFFSGVNTLTPASLFGDGLRCAGGSITRLEVAFTDASGNVSTANTGIGAAIGATVGSTSTMQIWFRDVGAGAPCGSGFNTSSAMLITWN